MKHFLQSLHRRGAETLRALALVTFLFLLCASATLRSHAASATPPAKPIAALVGDAPESFYAAGTFAVAPFASYRVHEFGKLNGKLGGGLAFSYFPADNFAVELETLSEDIDDSHWADAFTEAGVNFKGYLPIGATGLAPYLLVGYTRSGLDGVSPHQNRMNAGAGLEWRASKRFGVFADGRWTHDFATLGHALFRVGGNLSF